jgi:hypothetical protein
MAKGWRGPRTPTDPIYSTTAHRTAIQYWRTLALPCAICGRLIDYTANGQTDRWSFHLDHITPVATARARGWTDQQISAITNTRPTHRGCNTRAGARLGQRRQRAKRRRRTILNTSRQW